MKPYSRVHFCSMVLSVICLHALLAQPVRAADENTITEDDVITGVMNITFKTRTNLDTSGDLKTGSPALGAQDQYNFQMTVAKTTQYNGDIFRQPKLYSSVLGRAKQERSGRYADEGWQKVGLQHRFLCWYAVAQRPPG